MLRYDEAVDVRPDTQRVRFQALVRFQGLVILGFTLAVTSCASAPAIMLIGPPRPALSADRVRLYLEPPRGRYERMAVIDASSAGSFALGAGANGEVVIRRLTEQAGRLGANGLMLQDLDGGGADVAAGAGLDATRDHAIVGLGVSGRMFSVRHGRGVAIWVEPD